MMSKQKPVMSHDPLAGVDEAEAAPQETVAEPESAAEAGPFVLDSNLTIAEVGEVHPLMLAQLQGGEPVVMDASHIEAIDGAGIQLLAAFVKGLGEKSQGFSWGGVSEKLLQSAQQMGVEEALQLQGVQASA